MSSHIRCRQFEKPNESQQNKPLSLYSLQRFYDDANRCPVTMPAPSQQPGRTQYVRQTDMHDHNSIKL